MCAAPSHGAKRRNRHTEPLIMAQSFKTMMMESQVEFLLAYDRLDCSYEYVIHKV